MFSINNLYTNADVKCDFLKVYFYEGRDPPPPTPTKAKVPRA